MNKKTLIQEPDDFSPILGGPLYQLLLRSGLTRLELDGAERRIAAVWMLTWLPLLLLSARDGHAIGTGVPFLYDCAAQARLLVALPVLIAAEHFVHHQIRPVVRQFLDRGIVPPEEVPKFSAAMRSATRLRESVLFELGLLVLVYTLGNWLWRDRMALPRATWYATAGGAGRQFTLAGYWYMLVSLPIFQFILVRWYGRLFIWFQFLWRVSRLNLRLQPSHPDRAGGLGFVGDSIHLFGPILFAQGTLLSGLVANRIFYEGQHLLNFKVDGVGVILLVILFMLGPLTMFTPHLYRAKRQGKREYGLLAMRYTQEFDEKWLRGGAPAGEALIGSSDIQSLADLANSFSVVDEMRLVPFGGQVITRLALMTLAPLLPLTLTVWPLNEMVDHLIKTVL